VISIRRRLLAVLLTAITLMMIAGAFGSYRLSRSEVGRVFDYHLRQLALSLRNQDFSTSSNPLSPGDNEFHFVIQVWAGDGKPLYFSNPQADLPNRSQPGFSTLETAEASWRIYTLLLHGQVIQVAQPRSVRDEIATAAAFHTVLPFLLMLPLLAGSIWWLIGGGLAPLQKIARSVSTRSPNSLEPLQMHGVPAEARPLVESINNLLERLDAALVSQRSFVADAAHELRTPLTALQLQAQLTERAETQEDRRIAMAELKRGLQRAIHVVQQLLTLARQDPADALAMPLSAVSLAELIALATADQASLAGAKNIDLGISEADENAVVQGNFEALRTLAANLIDNAVRYTPAGGRIDVAVRCRDGRCWIEVDDSGPGIPVEDRERVFDRFFRNADNEEPGSGLGLAIVKAIAARHGACVSLASSALGGLSARISFPHSQIGSLGSATGKQPAKKPD